MRVIVFCFLVLNASSVKAEDIATSTLPLQQGRWNLGVSTSLGYNEHRGGAIRLEADLQYFVVDRFSLGVTAATDFFRGIDNNSFGVVGTYYFYTLANSAFYLSQSVTWDTDRRDSYDKSFINTRTTLGYNFFFDETIAAGPRVQYEWNPNQTAYEKGGLFVGYGLSVFF